MSRGKTVDVPKPEMTDYEKVQIAVEVAFKSLIDQAQSLGLHLQPVEGLMYLPTEELTRQFQDACKDILNALKRDVPFDRK